MHRKEYLWFVDALREGCLVRVPSRPAESWDVQWVVGWVTWAEGKLCALI